MFAIARKSTKLIQRGFTLIELLIVVIILAILAAILIPQFSSSTVDAQEAALDANLNGLRSAIELYQVQHNGKYPGAATAVATVCSIGSAGTGAINTPQAVIEQLTTYSNADGTTCTAQATQTPLGPYIRKGIPADPIKNVATIAVTTAGVPLTSGAGVVAVQTGGWAYDVKTGEIVMNSDANDSKSKKYYTH